MNILVINKDKQIRDTLRSVLNKPQELGIEVTTYENVEDCGPLNTVAQSTLALYDYIFLDNATDVKLVYDKVHDHVTTKIIYYGSEMIGYEDMETFKQNRKYFDLIVPTTQLARMLLNVLLKEYVVKEIPTFYINEFTETSEDRFTKPTICAFTQQTDEYDPNLFTIISKCVNINSDTTFMLFGNPYEHMVLQQLLYLNNLNSSVFWVEDITKKNLDAIIPHTSQCIVYYPEWNDFLRYPLQYGVQIFAPDIPDYTWILKDFESENKHLIKTQYYDENIKKMDFDQDALSEQCYVILDADYLKSRRIEQTKTVKPKIYNKEKLIKQWLDILNQDEFENISLMSNLNAEIATINNRGFFDEVE